jgi:hypothetical protein
MIDFLMMLAYALTRLFRSRARLEAEILVLRHQLNILQQSHRTRTNRRPTAIIPGSCSDSLVTAS